ncbi:hypothetical protein JCM24511_09771 [Saitozyma sp. JCM 24511]|nr:hypothetical protein JCM24511_09771 [Saitozyma sp. JCM 24511]
MPRVVREKAIDAVPFFLGHRFPRMRSLCAEQLYLGLMELADMSAGNSEMEAEAEVESGSDELEDILLEVEWTAERPRRSADEGGAAQEDGSGSGGVIQDVKRLLRARVLGRGVS